MADQSTFRPATDAYTGMLVVSLLAMIAGIALLFVDIYQYPEKGPPRVPTKAEPLPKKVIEEKPPEGEKKEGEPKAEEKQGEPKQDAPK